MSKDIVKITELANQLAHTPSVLDQIDLLNSTSWDLSRLHPQESYDLAKRALLLSEESEDELRAAESLKNMAHCLRLLSRFAIALEHGLKALSFATSIENDKLIGDLQYVCGSIHQHLGNKGSAMSFYKDALKMKISLKDLEGEAWVRNSIGDHLMTGGEYEEAKKYFEKVISSQHGNQVLKGIGLYNLGEIHYNLDEFAKAKSSLIKGWKLGIDLDFALMIAYCGALLGRILSKEGDPNAEEHLKEALVAAEKVGSKERMYDIHMYWYEHLKSIGDVEGALQHFEQFHYLKEEVFNEASAEKVQNVQLEFNTKILQKEAELERKKREELSNAYAEIEKLSLVASKTNSGVVILDARGKTLWVNEGYTRITGYNLSDIQDGQPGDMLVQDAVSNEALLRMRDMSSKNLPFVDQIQVNTKDKKRRWLQISNTPILSDNGEIQKQIEIVDDITDRITAEKELATRNLLIEEQNKDITASIRYAERIQTAMLPSKPDLSSSFDDHFVIYSPKDIVSGDFYWFETKGDNKFLAVADCTGHGVPGAFVSMMGHNLLNQIVNDSNISDPGTALDMLDRKVTEAFTKEESNSLRDGMDLIFMVYNPVKMEIEYSGAYRPIYLIRNGELKEFKSPKISIGGFDNRDIDFTCEKIDVQKGDQFYMFSDGIVDQFGGENGKKFMTKRLKDLLIKVEGKSMEDQKSALLESWNNWKGELEQVDDVCMVGFRI